MNLIILGNCFYQLPSLNEEIKLSTSNGDPLFLTPYIQSGQINIAKNLSKVNSLKGSIKSYSGFLTVNEKYFSNIFFWFFPAETNSMHAPVVVWLQGGPGVSSLFGLFSEHGPYNIDENLNIFFRKYSWTKTLSMLYIDNPVGTGYSFTNSTEGYSKNEKDVGVNLYNAVSQFFKLFPSLLMNDFFITGESYAGKYVPALAYEIHLQNKIAAKKINLKGIAIGNGFCDPIHMLNYGNYLYEIGLIDSNAKKIFDDKKNEAVALIQKKEYINAFYIFDTLLNTDLSNITSFFTNVTGFQNYYNYLKADTMTFDAVTRFVQMNFVREKIHVGNLPFHTDQTVELNLIGDMMRSVAPLIEVLIENYRILIYNGQLDIIVAYPLTEEFLKNLKWNGANKYKGAPRKIWKIKNNIAGYFKTVNNLIEVMVRNAGHMVPTDQPLFAFDMINRFVYYKSF